VELALSPIGEVSVDPVIDAYMAGVDRTLIQENLRKSPEERLLQLQRAQAFIEEVRAAGFRMRQS